MAHMPFKVVDPKLAAGRGEDFSASRQREKAEELMTEEGYRLPMNHRVEDSLEDEGLQMASTHEAIPGSNVGFQMLQRMGWKGQGLGPKGEGIVEPVGGGSEAGVRLGLGKQEEDDFYTSSDNIQRKRLEVEIQADEDVSRAAMRELKAEREQRIKEDVTNIKRTFYCEVCHKQYSSAAEMEVHLSSYDHHHKKRLVEMRSAENERTRKERDRRERRRQDKEMARLNEQIQRAHGLPPEPDAEPPLPPEAPPPPPTEDLPPLPEQAPPPSPPPGCPPIEPAGPSVLHADGGRSAVQFAMSSSVPAQTAKVLSLAVRKAGVQKKPGKLKSSVAAFAMDSDDEG